MVAPDDAGRPLPGQARAGLPAALAVARLQRRHHRRPAAHPDPGL